MSTDLEKEADVMNEMRDACLEILELILPISQESCDRFNQIFRDFREGGS